MLRRADKALRKFDVRTSVVADALGRGGRSALRRAWRYPMVGRLAARAVCEAVVRPEAVAFGVRGALPPTRFWQTHMHGTRQNASGFAGHKYMRQPGAYPFRLRTAFNTRELATGIYTLVVTARDLAGNAGSLRQVFTVRNRRRAQQNAQQH
jgi:hypothetical protein